MPQHNYKTSAALNSMMRDQVFSQDYSQLIKELHFTIDSDFVRAFPRLLTRLSNHPFKELKLSFTIPIAPNSALFLISQLLGENIRGLTHLKLNMRHISEIDTLLLGLMEEIQISNSMKRNNSLESVTLEPPVDTNNIQVYTLFIEALQFMAKLKNLTLKIAPAQERGLAMLLRNTTTLTNLRLTLGWPTNTSTSQSITRLFESIEQNKSLKHLHIEKLPRLNANTLLM